MVLWNCCAVTHRMTGELMEDSERMLMDTLVSELRATQRENSELRKQLGSIQLELARTPLVVGEIVNSKIIRHEQNCARIRWRNQVIIALLSGATGGIGSAGLIRMISVIVGG